MFQLFHLFFWFCYLQPPPLQIKTMVLEAVWVIQRLQVSSSDKLSENTAVDIHLSDGTDHCSGGQIIHVAGGPNPSSHAGYFI